MYNDLFSDTERAGGRKLLEDLFKRARRPSGANKAQEDSRANAKHFNDEDLEPRAAK